MYLRMNKWTLCWVAYLAGLSVRVTKSRLIFRKLHEEMNLEPENIFYGVLAFSWIEFFWGSYLSHRQRKIYKKHVEVPDEVKGLLDEETFTKARLYALDKSNFGAFQGIFSQVLSTVFMVYFAFKFLWDVSGEFYSRRFLFEISYMYIFLGIIYAFWYTRIMLNKQRL